MGGRYYISGVQLGLLMSLESGEDRIKLLQSIMDDQFIGNFDAEEWKKELKLLEGVSKE